MVILLEFRYLASVLYIILNQYFLPTVSPMGLLPPTSMISIAELGQSSHICNLWPFPYVTDSRLDPYLFCLESTIFFPKILILRVIDNWIGLPLKLSQMSSYCVLWIIQVVK